MITLCHAAKGGSGTTVVACTRALGSTGPALLVDIEGDVTLALGLPEPDRPGVLDWLVSDAPIAHLDDLLVDVTPHFTLLPARRAVGPGRTPPAVVTSERPDRWDGLVDWLTEWAHHSGGSVVIDAGTTRLPASFVEQCDQRLLVTRACYLSLHHAGLLPVAPTGVVLVDEPGRALSTRDVERSARAPIVATVDWDIRVARSIDAGLLRGAIPRSLHKALARVAA